MTDLTIIGIVFLFLCLFYIIKGIVYLFAVYKAGSVKQYNREKKLYKMMMADFKSNNDKRI